MLEISNFFVQKTLVPLVYSKLYPMSSNGVPICNVRWILCLRSIKFFTFIIYIWLRYILLLISSIVISYLYFLYLIYFSLLIDHIFSMYFHMIQFFRGIQLNDDSRLPFKMIHWWWPLSRKKLISAHCWAKASSKVLTHLK